MVTYNKNKKKFKSLSYMIIGTILFIGIGAGGLYTIEQYNNPKLYGKWISTETHEQVVFNEDGTVTLDETIYVPKFSRTAPNQMLYTIEDKEFETYYKLEGRSLFWGISEEYVEEFKRK